MNPVPTVVVRKIVVEHSCGHTQEHPFFGPVASAERTGAKSSLKPCDECVVAERIERSRPHAEANAAAGLPPLKGTPKQIAWAEQIRHEISPLVVRARDFALARLGCDKWPFGDAGEDIARKVRDAADSILRLDDSGHWIGNRNQIEREYADEMDGAILLVADAAKRSFEERWGESDG